jgi:hypothetical protein
MIQAGPTSLCPPPPTERGGALTLRYCNDWARVSDKERKVTIRMSNNTPWVFVDCEARGISPVNGTMTEFGAVHYDSRDTFHGRLFESSPDPVNPAVPVVGRRVRSDLAVAEEFGGWLGRHLGSRRAVLVSDNPAYDFMWIAGMFDIAGLPNPFGHSGRRIGDFWAGLQRDWSDTQRWKQLRVTRHDHNPVHDALGNVEAFAAIMESLHSPGRSFPEKYRISEKKRDE